MTLVSPRFFCAVACALLAAPVAAQDLSLATVFETLEQLSGGGRDAMDVAGAWDGSTDRSATDGDRMRLTVSNGAGSDTAFDLSAELTLPAGFRHVSGAVFGVPGTVVSGTTGTLSIAFPADTDLAPGGSLQIELGVVTDASVAAGTYTADFSVAAGSADGLANVSAGPAGLSFLVRSGAGLLIASPASQTLAVGGSADFALTVTNTGLGGLFDVTLDETAILSSAGLGLQLDTMTQTGPAGVAAAGTAPVLTLPYLAPGETFAVDATALVVACTDLVNSVRASSRAASALGAAPLDASAQVALDLQVPLVAVAASPASLLYAAPSTVRVDIDNLGLGRALGLELATNVHQLGVDVVAGSVSAGWTYAGSGRFALSGDGILTNGAATVLEFDVQPSDPCTSLSGGTVIATAEYANDCGDAYAVPTAVFGLAAPTDVPDVALTAASSVERLEVGDSASYTIAANAANVQNLAGGALQVLHTIPAELLSSSASVDAGSLDCLNCTPGTSLVWTLTPAQAAAGATLTITYDAPTDTCAGGQVANFSASVSTASTAGCSVSDSASASVLWINSPDPTASLNFEVGSPPEGRFETGLSTADGARDAGEGEFVPFEASYDFGAAQSGQWSMSTFSDDFAGAAGQALVPGSLEASIDAGAFAAVPGASITQSTGGLGLDLGFVGAQLGNDNLGGVPRSLRLRYRTTVPDAALGGSANATLLQRCTLSLNGASGSGSCGGDYVQGAYVPLGRAGISPTLSIPSVTDVCETFTVTANLQLQNDHGADSVVLELDDGGAYAYVPGQTPVFGGGFSAGTVNVTELPGDVIRFAFTGAELNADASVQFQAARRAQTGSSPEPLTAEVLWDSEESAHSALDEYSTDFDDSPALVRLGELQLQVLSESLTVADDSVAFDFAVTNTGNGALFELSLLDTLPAGITVDAAATDAANPGLSVTVGANPSEAAWSIAELAPGTSRTVRLVGSITPSAACASMGTRNQVTASWGCGGVTEEQATSNEPEFLFPGGSLSVLHDTTTSVARLCETGQVEIVLVNTGGSSIYDLALSEVLEPLTYGIDLIAGTVEAAVDGGAFAPVANPSGIGTAGSPYVWTQTQIPALAELGPQVDGGSAPSILRVRFDISSTEALAGQAPTLNLAAAGDLACGDTVSANSPGATIPVEAPSLTTSATGRNVTAGGTFGSRTLGVPGDTVRWRVRVTNSGELTARNVRLAVDLPDTGVSTGTLSPADAGANTSVSDGGVYPLPDLAAGGFYEYEIEQVLGADCSPNSFASAVTFGCAGNGPNAASNLPNPPSSGTTALEMDPDFSGSGLTRTLVTLPDGRAEIAVQLTNSGAQGSSFGLEVALPATAILDPSFAPALDGGTPLSLSSSPPYDPNTPMFAFAGNLDAGESAILRLRVLPASGFDTAFDPFVSEESSGNGNDPSPPASANVVATLDWENACADPGSRSLSASLDLARPDLDLEVEVAPQVIAPGATVTVPFQIVARGEFDSSVSHPELDLTVGSGWSSVGISVDGGAPTTATSFDVSDFGALARGDSVAIEFTGTATTGGPLELSAVLGANLHDDSGTERPGDVLVTDAARARILGVSLAIARDTTSGDGTSLAATTGDNLAIGETVTWRAVAAWFGGSSGELLEDALLRLTLPDEFEYLSHAVEAGGVATSAVTTPSGSPNRLQFDLADIDGSGDFEFTIAGRLLDGAGVDDEDEHYAELGMAFDALGDSFASSAGADGLGGVIDDLHAHSLFAAAVPVLGLTHRIAAVSGGTAGSFGGNLDAEAGDRFEYRIEIANTGSGPAFALDLDAVLQASQLELLAASGAGSDGIDNDGDGLIDEALEGSFTAGPAGAIEFTDASTQLAPGSPSATFAQLDGGETLVLRYRADAGAGSVPQGVYSSLASLTAASLPGTPDEAEEFAPTTVEATATIGPVALALSIVASSNPDTALGDVSIGEQVRLRVETVLPAGRTPGFRITDLLPPGLRLLDSVSVTLGSAITGSLQSTTPASLPAAGGPAGLALEWDFGTLDVTPDADPANRRVRIDYEIQVLNLAAASAGTSFSNAVNFAFTGGGGTAQSGTITVVEPDLSVARTIAPASGFDAGDTLTFTASVLNSGGAAAYDIDLIETLPAGLTYVPGSALLDGVAIPDPDIAGSVLTFGRSQAVPQDYDLAPGLPASVVQYSVVVGDGVLSGAVLTPSVVLDATSLNGGPGPDLGEALDAAGTAGGERTGGGSSANDLAALDASQSATASSAATLAAAAELPALEPGEYRVGDLVTLRLTAALHEGTYPNFELRHTLPTGLAFVRVVSSTSGDGYTTDAPNFPAANATGALTFGFGTLVNAGDGGGEDFELVLEARVLDDSDEFPAFDPATVTHTSAMAFDGASAAALVNAADIAVTVLQPELVPAHALASGQAGTVGADEPVEYTVTVTNDGEAPAYEARVELVLPPGMRDTAPTVLATALEGTAISLSAAAYVPATGTAIYTFPAGTAFPPGEILRLDYRARTDADVGGPLALSGSARALEFRSKPAVDALENRTYGASSAATVSVSTPGPADVAKLADRSGLNIGESVTWTITAPATAVDVGLYDVRIADTVPAIFRVTGVTTNAAALGATATGAGAPFANALEIGLDYVPAGAQAQVTITAVLENQAGVDTSVEFGNVASLRWAAVDGGALESAIASPSADGDVLEPELAVDLQLGSTDIADPDQGPQAGDTVTYRYRIENTGDGPAHDLDLGLRASPDLIDPLVSAAPDNPGAAGTGTGSPTMNLWTWGVAGPLAPGAVYEFDVRYTIGPDAMPFEVLSAFGELEWTSIAGASADERDGGGGLNDYSDDDSDSPVQTTIGPVALTKTDLGAGVYAIGDEVTWRLEMSAGQGAISQLVVEDVLPAGLEFLGASLSASAFQTTAGGAVAIQSGPAAGATGTLRFTIGDIESTGPNPALQLDLTARVLDVPANAAAVELSNSAGVELESPPRSSLMRDVPGVSPSAVTVGEPRLNLALDPPALAALGAPFQPIARITNSGAASAWQPTIQVAVPAGARDADPSGLPANLTISGGRSATLTAGSDYALAWDGSSGVLTVNLLGAAGRIDPGEQLELRFTSALDDDAVDTDGLDYLATATTYASQDSSGAPPVVVRTYPTALGVGSTDTPNGAAGDDATDGAAIEISAPVVSLTKAVDATEFAPGSFVTYTVTVANAGSAAAQIERLIDDLPAVFEPGSLELVSQTPAGGTLTLAGAGGVSSTGQLLLEDAPVAALGQLELVFRGRLAASLPSDTVFANQARLELENFTEPRLSDSADSADNDGIESGNDGGDANDDDPTRATIGSAPVIALTKTASDDNGAPLEIGDVITYTIQAANSGDEDALAVLLADPTPSFSSYVPGSTRLDGLAVPDLGADSALGAGLALQPAGAASGELPAGSAVTVSFQVTVDEGDDDGTLISNQALLSGAGAGSGPFAPVASDDPGTSTEGDATVLAVGTTPVLEAVKTATDLDGGELLPGDSLLYRIAIRNAGGAAADGLVFTDPLPAGTGYEGGLLFFDADGDGPAPPQNLTDAADGDAGDVNASVPGAVVIQLTELAPGAAFEVGFVVEVDDAAAPGQQIFNQATVDAIGLTAVLSDADGNDANGDQPTVAVVGTAPALLLTKSVADLNGGLTQAGDRLRYTLELANLGNADATGVLLSDPTPPAGTDYVEGSTRLDGVVVADIAGGSNLAPGLFLGPLEPGRTRRVTFEVDVAVDAAFAALISNQASYTADGGLAGVSDSDVDDGVEGGNDPDNPNDDDPTLLQVGAAPGAASVSGLVWLDLDHDNVWDPGSEDLQSGWTVEVLRDGVFLTSTVTGSDGAYGFNGLPPGDGYSLRFLHPESDTVYGGPSSDEPGVDLSFGEIGNLTLQSGDNVVEQNLPIDPSGIVYDSIARTPIPGATLTVSGPPGFDPATMLPPGQQGQVTGADGFYRFDLINGAPAGVYSAAFDVPPGYLPSFPSLLILPEAAPLDPTGFGDPFEVQPQATAPALGDDTTYYTSFDLAPGDPNVVNNHVPLDPVLEGAIAITKTTPRKTVERGGFVPYTLRLTNTLNATLTPTDVVDVLPPGFKFVEGSARIDGAPAVPTLVGREVRFDGLSLPALGTLEIDLVAIVGAGTGDGKFVNQAFARNPIADARISNIAEAAVLVVPDALFDHTDILGKVFDDRNGNGVQDRGEPGVPGVRIATTRGLVVTTDEHGRYHLVCPEVPNRALGTNFVLKIDTRSLPTGFRPTTENPRVVRLTRGKFATADFGVTPGRLLRVDLERAAFAAGDELFTEAVEQRLLDALAGLDGGAVTLRMGYVRDADEDPSAAESRLARAADRIEELWQATGHDAPLDLELLDASLRRAEPGANASGTAQGESSPDAPAADAPAERSSGRQREVASVHTEQTPRNAEATSPGELPHGGDGSGLSLTLDGRSEMGGPTPERGADADRRADLALHGADLQVRVDDLILEPALAVSVWPEAWMPFTPLTFESYSNYAAFVERAELRLFAAGDSSRGEPLAVVPLELGSGAVWTPGDSEGDLHYVLRVYDAEGRFDETARQLLPRLKPGSEWPTEAEIEALRQRSWGQDQLVRQTIPIEGTAITVSGRRVPEGLRPIVDGLEVPLSPSGDFAVRTILPGGGNTVDVQLLDDAGRGLSVTRDVTLPEDEWFFVALADLTVGQNSVSGPADLFVSEDSFLPAGEDQPADGDLFVNGRLAFYLKGHVLGGALLTASLDTGDEPLEDILERLNEKDPRAFLRRLDPTVYYPVYGDDSTTIEDAPTRGKFYVRLERGDDRVIWGDFTVRMTETELAQVDRALYGAGLRWSSEGETAFGESATEVELFAAEPGTLAGRDELRGTGGSLYYTSRQDLTIGSERVRIEVRDKVSGLVVATEDLVPNQDYTIDYLQGRVFLNAPLGSVSDDGDAVETGPNSGDPQFLVVRYEYTPGFDQLDDLAVGGRVSQWLGENVEVGATYSSQQQQGQDGELYGVDVTLRKSESTYLRAEFAGSEGPGQGTSASLDGGFSFGGNGGTAAAGESATALHVEAAVDLAEVSGGGVGGDLSAYMTTRERGFDAPGQFSNGDTTLFGARYRGELSEKTAIEVELDGRDEDGRGSQTAAEVDVVRTLDEHWRAELGVRYDDLDSGALASVGSTSGDRTDTALRLAYDSLRAWDTELFLQGTLARAGTRKANNRYGVGLGWRPNDRWRLSGGISGGNGGLGGRLGAEFRIDDRTETYLTYLADVDRSDTGLAQNNGSLVAGARHRFSDSWSVYGEERVGLGGAASLVHAYGLDFTPDDRWSFGFQGETGVIQNPDQPELERVALSLTGGYSSEDVKFSSALEYREDEGSAVTRETWLLRSQLALQVDPDWRAITRFQTALADDSSGAFFDGDFTEAVLGLAYRPVETNRLNALFKFTYLEDVPTAGQIAPNNAGGLFAQRSRVLSADATYDLLDWLSIGGKLAGRMGELRTEDSGWYDSLAWLALVRLDLHLVEEWDWLLEGRRLEVTEAEDVLIGALTAVYRHIGENLKFGLGYDFADFSDDLTDLDHDSQGWFVNLVGAF